MNPYKIILKLGSRYAFSQNKQCVLCDKCCAYFLPYKDGSKGASNFMKTISMIGSDLDNYECPWCGCHDRERHVFMYMMKEGLLPDLFGKSVLHFAPEKRLTGKILASSPRSYIKCDLFPHTPDVMKVDILNIPFDSTTFDLLIANHVMEHVPDDIKALREIARVLKPGGFAILQTPFSAKLHVTWEDAGIDTDEARIEVYGQEDHVRLYGRDIFQRFSTFGLISRVRGHREILPDTDPARFGLNKEEPFFLFQKADSHVDQDQQIIEKSLTRKHQKTHLVKETRVVHTKL